MGRGRKTPLGRGEGSRKVEDSTELRYSPIYERTSVTVPSGLSGDSYINRTPISGSTSPIEIGPSPTLS